MAAHVLHSVEELLLYERLVESLDGLGLVAPTGDVAGVGGVAEHLPHGVRAEAAPARGPLLIDVQPLGEGAVGVLPGGVELEELTHVGRALRVGGGDAVLSLGVAPGEAAGEQSLAGLLAQAHLGPEGEGDRVVLVEDLVYGLREERGGVVGVGAEGLGYGDDVDAELCAQELLVALGLDRVAGEAAGVEHEHGVEAVLHRVLDQALKAGALVGVAAGLEVQVLLDQAHVVVGGVAGDGLPLAVGE
ncbi:MAG TPA: hypothetical protein VMG62_00775 [Solirubrobacteraceae bacterium]|nr:hypothetical protein [Solirubrobacteraceae bacterium]